MKRFFTLLLAGLCLAPLAALAQSTPGSAVGLPNPIACDNLVCVFLSVIRLFLAALGLFGMVMFMWGGLMMLTSAGNAERVEKGKQTLVWATLGIIIVLGSWVVLRFVLTTLTKVTTG